MTAPGAHDEQTSTPGAQAAATGYKEYRWSVLVAVILSVATLASAWCGFQASSWSSHYAHETRAANGERFEAARQSDIADRQTTNDVLIFSTWLEAEVNGNGALAAEIEARFLTHFRPAFEAWRSLPAGEEGVLPTGTPFEQAEYVLPTQGAADAASARALAALDSADIASAASSRYILTSVLFASVLFLAGIASKLAYRRPARAVVAVAGVALAVALTLLVTSPLRF